MNQTLLQDGPRSALPRIRRLAFAAVAALAVFHPLRLSAQAPPRIEPRVLQTDDNWQIYVTFYSVGGDAAAKETPVVLLLHGDKENRLVWEGAKGLAPLLQSKGYAVVTVDLRKHGQSSNVPKVAADSPAGGKNDGKNLQADDYQAMVESDLEAVKRFIYEQHQLKRLNMNKLAIIAAESSAIVAMHFAANDWNKEPYDDGPTEETRTPRGHDVRALVLLSPPQRVRGLPLGDALSEVRDPEKGIAVLTLYGKLNKADARDAMAIYHKMAGVKATDDRIYIKGYPFNLRGADLLGKKEIDAESTILTFLKKHLADIRGSDCAIGRAGWPASDAPPQPSDRCNPVKLGYNTNGLAFHRWDDALTLIAETGYRSVALTVDQACLNPFDAGLPVETAKFKALLERLQLASVIETGARFLLNPRVKHEPTLVSPRADDRAIRVDFLRRCIDIARELGSDAVSFWSGALTDAVDADEAWQRLIDGCKLVADYAERRCVKLAFEPEPGMVVERMSQFARLCDAIDAAHFGLTLDVGHVHCLSDGRIADHLRAWQSRLYNVHIEDMRRGVHEHIRFGEGDIDFGPVMAALVEIGYAGGVHVELSRHSHMAPTVLAESYEFLTSALKRTA